MKFPLWRRRRQEQLEEELRSHLEMAARDRIDRGEPSERAASAARCEFGNVALVQHVTRDQWGWIWLEDLLQDLRYAARTLRKSPAFTVVAVLTLALGIGANTAIFCVIHSVVLRPLPFAAPDRLVWLNGKFPQSDLAAVSVLDFVEYRASNQSFERLSAMGFNAGPSNLSGDKPEQVLDQMVSAEFFDTLGIHPLYGRDFVRSDEQVDLPQVAILGYGIWNHNFAGDPQVVGRTIRLDGQNLTVVGVLSVDLPLLSEAQIWLPTPLLNPGMNQRLAHFLKVVGRLKPGVTFQQSQSDLDAVAERIARQYPATNEGWTLRQRALSDLLIGPVRPALLIIAAAVALLLLIACANVANLLLARSFSRHREFALRTALGASRARILRQTLTESMMLALCGGAGGVLAANWGVHVWRAIAPGDLPRVNEIHLNWTVLAFTGCLSLLTGMIFGLIPAWQVSELGVASGLKESGRTSPSAARQRLGSALVIGEVAVSLTLLAGAVLLLKSFWLLIHVNPGFQTDHVITARLSLSAPAYDAARRASFWRLLEQRVEVLPGVLAAGATSELPLNREHSDNPFYIEGRTYAPSVFEDANFRQVTRGYLSGMRIPLIAGRWLEEHDNETSLGVIVVNQAFVARFFPGQSALGKHLQVLGDPKKTREIVGVVGNISHDSLAEPQPAEMYVPYPQYSPPKMNLVVRAAAHPKNLAAALRDTVGSIDKDVTLSAVRSMDQVIGSSVSQPRFSSQLLALFATLALVLAAIGLYGLMAYSVTQRRTEIGVRMALGASQSDVLRLVLGRGAILAVTGVALGLIAAFALTRLLSTLLFQVSPTDPSTLVGASLLLVAVALIACYIPARRAMRVDPMVALRYE
jgi:putative ABC transport system permease protein